MTLNPSGNFSTLSPCDIHTVEDSGTSFKNEEEVSLMLRVVFPYSWVSPSTTLPPSD